MVARCIGWWVAMLACCLAFPSWAMLPAPDVIVGRADADASGGWPVALWVIDGERSHFIVRAPRQQLGPLRWRPADAQALMALERFGAPTLTQSLDTHPCPAGLGRGHIVPPPAADPAGESGALAHPACGGRSCGGAAWRVDLSAQAGEVLPLARLLPGLAASRPEWLVLYVVSPLPSLPLKGVRQLHLADALRGPRSMAQWSQLRMPAEAAARFPAIHTALLEQAAEDQGLAQASVLMRADSLSSFMGWGLVGDWDGGEAPRRALGLNGDAAKGQAIVRLLLRLSPGDRPAVLAPQAGPWQAAAEYSDKLKTLEPWPETPSSCRRQLSAMNCEAACERKAPACLQLCLSQKSEAEASLQGSFDAIAERQRQAWRWIEQITGRPAAEWQTR